MNDDLTLEQIERIIANHESGVQLTGVNVYRQLKAAQEEIASLTKERDASRERALETDAMLHLIGHEVAFVGNDWVEGKWIGFKPVLICNDTFGYACADAEEVPEGDWRRIKSIFERFGEDGLIAWMAIARGYDPIEPRRTATFKEAKAFLESGELR